VTQWPWTTQTQLLKLTPAKVQLTNPNGSIVWTVATNSAEEPDLAAEGDFTGDGIADFVVVEYRPVSPIQYCYRDVLSETQLVFIDGANGRSWRPVPAMRDICWSYGYPTHQWAVGTTYIGPFEHPGQNDVVLFPYYAQFGSVLNFDSRHGWRLVRKDIAYPSTGAFDSVYNATNGAPCLRPPGASGCWVQYSHVANAIFVGGGGSTSGLLVMTSNRAVIYRPDLTPTSDLVWSYSRGGGRNYGLVESTPMSGGQMVTLVGGCSVSSSRLDMRTGLLSVEGCALFHHFEYFFVQGQKIVQHDGREFGWAGTDGLLQNRLEFPFPSTVPLTGTSMWSIFNFYRDGLWRVELLPNPADPAAAIEIPGWFVWGFMSDRSGHVLLAGTRMIATSTTTLQSFVPPWQFDILRWQEGALVSVAHYDGVSPSMVLYPPGPGYHATNGDTFGLVENTAARGMPNQLLVESAAGNRSWVSVPDIRDR
jgi:hypothetical protein